VSHPAAWVKRAAASFGVRFSRSGAANRFQAVDECLRRMKSFGYQPRVVIDGGANLGQFHDLVVPIFPDAHYHLIEPQPSCAGRLRELAARRPGRTEFQNVAITEPGVASLRMTGYGSTGAYAAKDGEPAELEVPATSLDAIFAGRLRAEDRTLLKLDLESHELKALSGARKILPFVEAVVVEVAFYDINRWGRAVFSEVLAFMIDERFELFDIAALGGRPRDQRLRLGDVIFVRGGSFVVADDSWD
jgi:FkbM family methyltransferase